MHRLDGAFRCCRRPSARWWAACRPASRSLSRSRSRPVPACSDRSGSHPPEIALSFSRASLPSEAVSGDHAPGRHHRRQTASLAGFIVYDEYSQLFGSNTESSRGPFFIVRWPLHLGLMGAVPSGTTRPLEVASHSGSARMKTETALRDGARFLLRKSAHSNEV